MYIIQIFVFIALRLKISNVDYQNCGFFFKVNIIPHTWFPHPKMACSLPRSDTGTQLKKLQDLMQRFELFAHMCVCFLEIGSIWTHFQNKLTWRFMIYIIFCCLVASVFYFIMQTLHFHDYLGTIHSVLIDEDFTSPKMHNRSVRFLINIYNIYIFYFMRYKKIVFNFFSQEFNIINISFCHSLSTSFYLKEE